MKNGVDLPRYEIYREHGSAPMVEHVAWLGAGDFCDCYLVNERYVFRFARHEEASAAMRREVCLLPKIGPFLSVAVPQIAFAGRVVETEHEMMGYALIPGEVLELEVLQGLPERSRAMLMAQMAAFVRQLHAIPPDVVAECGLPARDLLSEFAGVMERARVMVRPRLTDKAWRYHKGLWAGAVANPLFRDYQPVVLHGDLSPDHFLADREKGILTGVIDFGDACIGDPAWDFVYILEDYGEEIFNAVVAQYAPDHAAGLARRVVVYQYLNNVAYALSVLEAGEEDAIEEALEILAEQAG